MKESTKGNAIILDFGTTTNPTFIAGGKQRYLIETAYASGSLGVIGYAMINATLRFADGTEAYAVIEVDEASSGEHCGTGVFLPDGTLVFQDDPDFYIKLGKTMEEYAPYRYHPDGEIRTLSNHHIGSDGWST